MINFPPFNFDITILHVVNNFHFSWLDPIMVFFADIGEYAIIWILIALILYIKNKKTGKVLLLTLAIALIIEVIINDGVLKHLLFRERPYLFLTNIHHLGPNWTNSSFVSGHTASSTAAIIVLFNYSKRCLKNPLLPCLLYSIFYILITWSRFYLGMHYPTDVVGGIAVGAVSAYAAFLLIKKLK